jgi:hypothetical protein
LPVFEYYESREILIRMRGDEAAVVVFKNIVDGLEAY